MVTVLNDTYKMMMMMIRMMKTQNGQFWSYNLQILHGNRSKWYLHYDHDNDDHDVGDYNDAENLK